MRTTTALAWIVFIACAAGEVSVFAQQGAPQHPHQFSPLVASEPRAFSASHDSRMIDARPLESGQPPARRVQPPVNFRQVSAEEPVAKPGTRLPLRLAPRGQSSRPSA